ncbi:hypothetical protein ACLOJK_021479 [Asimina triloba]
MRQGAARPKLGRMLQNSNPPPRSTSTFSIVFMLTMISFYDCLLILVTHRHQRGDILQDDSSDLRCGHGWRTTQNNSPQIQGHNELHCQDC